MDKVTTMVIDERNTSMRELLEVNYNHYAEANPGVPRQVVQYRVNLYVLAKELPGGNA